MNDRLDFIVEPLLSWFEQHARVLPWRNDPTPYRVWVSEIMLQQTRVEAVKPYYERFMKALPDVASLASCKEEELLKLWEGLGYYNRVRNMQIAAKTIMEEYNGELPSDYRTLLSLKGIGEYTAGAIASIAMKIPVPAVDGNVLRVISRVLASREDILKQSVKKRISSMIQDIIPKEHAGAFNQSLMELGACICIPNGEPHCSECPLNTYCQAHIRRLTHQIPYKTPAKARRIEEKTVLVIREGNRVALHKRPSKGLLAGLYELPNMDGQKSAEEVLDFLKEKGLLSIRIQELPKAKHIFSHVEWHMTGFLILVEEQEQMPVYMFVEQKESEEKYPIPAAFESYARYMQIRIGQDRYQEE